MWPIVSVCMAVDCYLIMNEILISNRTKRRISIYLPCPISRWRKNRFSLKFELRTNGVSFQLPLVLCVADSLFCTARFSTIEIRLNFHWRHAWNTYFPSKLPSMPCDVLHAFYVYPMCDVWNIRRKICIYSHPKRLVYTLARSYRTTSFDRYALDLTLTFVLAFAFLFVGMTWRYMPFDTAWPSGMSS